MPDLDQVWVFSGAVFGSGQPSVNGAHMIEAGPGHWGADSVAINAASSGIHNGTDQFTVWLPEIQRLWRTWSFGGYGTAELINPVAKTWEPAGRPFSVGWPSDPGVCGAVIPDPTAGGAGFKAFVAYGTSTAATIARRINATTSNTGSPNPNLDLVAQPYGNTMPAAINSNSSWYYMGYDRPGSTQIVVAQPKPADTGVDLYILDISTWQWSGPLAIANNGFSINEAAGSLASLHKRFRYHPKYDAFYVVSGLNAGNVYALKRPAAVT